MLLWPMGTRPKGHAADLRRDRGHEPELLETVSPTVSGVEAALSIKREAQEPSVAELTVARPSRPEFVMNVPAASYTRTQSPGWSGPDAAANTRPAASTTTAVIWGSPLVPNGTDLGKQGPVGCELPDLVHQRAARRT